MGQLRRPNRSSVGYELVRARIKDFGIEWNLDRIVESRKFPKTRSKVFGCFRHEFGDRMASPVHKMTRKDAFSRFGFFESAT